MVVTALVFFVRAKPCFTRGVFVIRKRLQEDNQVIVIIEFGTFTFNVKMNTLNLLLGIFYEILQLNSKMGIFI